MELFDRTSGCLTDEGLQALADGQLDELSRLEAAEHLAFCDACLDRYTALLAGPMIVQPPQDLQKPVWQVLNIVSMLLICISTVFLKQHSVIDVLAAIPVCGIGYLLGFRVRENNPNGGATR